MKSRDRSRKTGEGGCVKDDMKLVCSMSENQGWTSYWAKV